MAATIGRKHVNHSPNYRPLKINEHYADQVKESRRMKQVAAVLLCPAERPIFGEDKQSYIMHYLLLWCGWTVLGCLLAAVDNVR